MESYYSHPKFSHDPLQLRSEFEIRYENENFSFTKEKTVRLIDIIKLYEEEYPDKSNSGVVFTPSAIAQSMSEITIDRWIISQLSHQNLLDPSQIQQFDQYIYEIFKDPDPFLLDALFNQILPRCKILDPCVGGGEFIVGCLNYLFQLINSFFPIYEQLSKKNPKIQCKWASKFAFIKDFLFNNIQMIDLNPLGLELTQIRIWDEILIHYPLIQWGDLFSYKCSALSHDFLDLPSSFTRGFQIILGNPPYLSSDSMSKYYSSNYIAQLKSRFTSVLKKGSKPDLFFYFIANALNLIDPLGFLCFIVPNRLLTNDYATTMREFLFSNAKIHLIANFNSEIEVFPSINVHPCIFLLEKREIDSSIDGDSQDEFSYCATEIKTIFDLAQFTLQNYSYLRIPQRLAHKYNLLFSTISEDEKSLLLVLQDLPHIDEFVTIHEAKRLAQFEKSLDKTIPVRINKKELINIPSLKQNHYLREIRGKDIQENYLNCQDNLIQLPMNYHKHFPNEPVLYIRELGEKIFCGIDWDRTSASMGYGGVYYVYLADFKDVSGNPLLNLLAFESFISSNIATRIYRILFQAGSWGTALKIRSSYLHQLPYWIPNLEVFAELAVWMEFLQILSQNCPSILLEYLKSLQFDLSSIPILFNKIKMLIDWLLYEYLFGQSKNDLIRSKTLLLYWYSTENNFVSTIFEWEKYFELIFRSDNDSFILEKIQIHTKINLENIHTRFERFEKNPAVINLTQLIQKRIF
jgi:hypothetical protein